LKGIDLRGSLWSNGVRRASQVDSHSHPQIRRDGPPRLSSHNSISDSRHKLCRPLNRHGQKYLPSGVARFAALRAAFPMACKKASRHDAKAQRLQHFFLRSSWSLRRCAKMSVLAPRGTACATPSGLVVIFLAPSRGRFAPRAITVEPLRGWRAGAWHHAVRRGMAMGSHSRQRQFLPNRLGRTGRNRRRVSPQRQPLHRSAGDPLPLFRLLSLLSAPPPFPVSDPKRVCRKERKGRKR